MGGLALACAREGGREGAIRNQHRCDHTKKQRNKLNGISTRTYVHDKKNTCTTIYTHAYTYFFLIYGHTYIHAHIHTYIHINMHIHMHVHTMALDARS